MRHSLLLSCLPLLVVAVSFGQSPSQTPTAVPVPPGSSINDAYKDEGLVFESFETIYTYAVDGTGEKRMKAVMRLQSEGAVKNFTVTSIPFAGGNEKVVVHYLRVRKPDGAVVETPGSDGMEMPQPVSQQAPFYSDLKMMQIPVRGLRVGDRLEYDISVNRTSSEAPGEFWGSETLATGVVMLKESIELRVPKKKYVQVWSPKFTAEKHDDGEVTVYRWTGSQLKPTPTKAEATSTAPKLADIQWTTFRDWASVGDWYRGLAKGRADVTPAIKAKADEVVAGLKTDDEKLKALYSFVAMQVRYVGVAFGDGRYQPHNAAETLLTQYGDCKDKHTLLQAMLKAEGYDADPALIGASIRLNEEVPSPSSFNHLITALHRAGQVQFLDTTSEVAPYGMLLLLLRDEKALVVPAAGNASLQTTPKLPPFENSDRFEAVGTLSENGEMKAHMVLTVRGDTEVIMRGALRQIAPVQMDQLTQIFSSSLGFSGTASGAKSSPPYKTDEPLKLEYDYKKEDFGDWPNRKIIGLLPWLGFPSTDEEPKDPILLGGPKVTTNTSRIHLPSAATATLPAAIHEDAGFASYDKTYTMDGHDVLVEVKLNLKVKEVPVADWKKYKAFYMATVGKDESWIVLKGIGGNTAAEDSMPESFQLLEEAKAAYKRGDWKGERVILEKAEKINPHEPYLYSMRGYTYMREHRYDEAEKNFRKELAAHPKEVNVHQLLVQTLTARSDMKGAETALRSAINELPEERMFPIMLSNLLVSDRKNDEAIEVLRAASKNLKGEGAEIAQGQLGSALIRANKKDEGIALLKPMLESSNLETANTAAYELANLDVELDTAEQTERRIIASIEPHIAKADIEDKNYSAASDSLHLAMYWDSLAWILMKQGKLSEAEPYLRAAWHNTYQGEIGLHYGNLLEKQGKLPEAMVVYRKAFDEKQASPAIREELEAAEERMEKKVPNPPASPGSLQDLRTFKLPGSEPKYVSGTVQMRIGPGGIEEAALIDGEKSLTSHLEAVKKIDVSRQLPPASSTSRIVRRGVLNCRESGCQIVLIPMSFLPPPM